MVRLVALAGLIAAVVTGYHWHHEEQPRHRLVRASDVAEMAVRNEGTKVYGFIKVKKQQSKLNRLSFYGATAREALKAK